MCACCAFLHQLIILIILLKYSFNVEKKTVSEKLGYGLMGSTSAML
jgi:hypothetical protein